MILLSLKLYKAKGTRKLQEHISNSYLSTYIIISSTITTLNE